MTLDKFLSYIGEETPYVFIDKDLNEINIIDDLYKFKSIPVVDKIRVFITKDNIPFLGIIIKDEENNDDKS